MKRVLLVVAWLCGGLLLVLICVALGARDRVLRLAHSWQERSDGVELADKLSTPRDLIEYFAQHPEQVSIASWELGHGAEGLFVHADRRQPVPAVSDLLVLARYAELAAAGDPVAQERISLARWETYLLPGSEAGAHLAALHALREQGRVETSVLPGGDAGAIAEPSVHTPDLIRALIRFGDHTAADYLMQRFGRVELDALALRLGVAAEDSALMPYSGVALSWLGTQHTAHGPELLARYRVLGRDAYVQLTWGLAARLREDRAFGEHERAWLEQRGDVLSLKEQAQLVAALLPRGTTRSYAELIQHIAANELPGSESMRAELEWPIDTTHARADHDLFAAQRGRLPGVLVSVSYARPKGRSGLRVCAVFLQQLPAAVWLLLSRGAVLPRLESELLEGGPLYALAKQRLAPQEKLTATTPRHQKTEISSADDRRSP